MIARIFASALYVAFALGGIAMAQQVEYSETSLDLNMDCTVVQSDDFGSTWACPGHKGIPVRVAERDRRMMVSYGLESGSEPAAKQTLKPYNRLDSVIEWRISNLEGHWKPFATILKFFTRQTGSETEGEVLVVTRIAPGATCHIAYVDALANPHSLELARKAADEKARDFDCAKDEPEYVGKFEAWEQ